MRAVWTGVTVLSVNCDGVGGLVVVLREFGSGRPVFVHGDEGWAAWLLVAAVVEDEAASVPLDVAHGIPVVGAVDLVAFWPGLAQPEAHWIAIWPGVGKG